MHVRLLGQGSLHHVSDGRTGLEGLEKGDPGVRVSRVPNVKSQSGLCRRHQLPDIDTLLDNEVNGDNDVPGRLETANKQHRSESIVVSKAVSLCFYLSLAALKKA